MKLKARNALHALFGKIAVWNAQAWVFSEKRWERIDTHTGAHKDGEPALGATVGVAYDTTAENTLYGCFQNKAPAGNITLPTLAFIAKVWATPKKPKNRVKKWQKSKMAN